MSKIADDTYNTLKEIFPNTYVEKEYYINYKNTRLFFDFYIKSLGLLFECDGVQHYRFVKHFHGTLDNFRAQKYRDNLKLMYLEDNPSLTLIKFYDIIDVINKQLVLDRIHEAQCKGDK